MDSNRQNKPTGTFFSTLSRIRDDLSSTVVVDTITTRFLLLFLFLLVIPMSAVIIFTSNILTEHMDEAIQTQMSLSRNLFHGVMVEQQERLSLLGLMNHEQVCREFSAVLCLRANNGPGGLMDMIRRQPLPRSTFYARQNGQLYTFRKLSGHPAEADPMLLGMPVDATLLNLIYERQPQLQTDIWVVAEPLSVAEPLWFARKSMQEYNLPVSGLLQQLKAHDDFDTLTLTVNDARYAIRQDMLYGPDHRRIARVVHILPLSRQELLKENFYLGIYIISVLSFVFSVLLAMLAARTITQPLLRLIQQVNTLSRANVMKDEVVVKGVYEINQLSEAFNRMVKRLQQEHKLKDEFVATLTHDLKVPLIAEKQTLAYLQKESYGPLTPDQAEVVDVLQSSNKSCLALVNGLLEVYRYDSGEVALVFESFNLLHLMHETLNELQSLAQDKSISIQVEADLGTDEVAAMVFADRLEIKRVLHNLISNAITNTPPHGRITCRMTDSKQFGSTTIFKVSDFQFTTLKHPVKFNDRLLIVIEDSGIGFSSEDLPHLFKQFAASRGRNPMSIGLGLYNCFQVVQAHNGVLWVESTEGEGSAVSFVLPQNKDAAQDRRIYRDRRQRI